MKRFCFLMVIAVLFVSAVFGQSPADRNSAPRRGFDRAAPDAVTINGTLQLEKGFIAVSSGDKVYYVPRLTRYIGFIEGLKEGAVVSIEGYTYNNFIFPLNVTLNGKSYDFAMKRPEPMNDRNRPLPDRRRDAVPRWKAPERNGPRWGIPGPNWGFYGPGGNRR
jgi:hypothetical protein